MKLLTKPIKCKSLLSGTILTIVCLLLTLNVSAADRVIKGVTTDGTTNTPLVGVSVQVKGTNRGVTSGAKGEYSITVSSDDAVLIFSYVGYVTVERRVGASSVVDVTLEENISKMNEVVVIGYGSTTKKEITGSVASLKEENFNQGSFTNAAGLLQGKVAGLQITNPDGGDPSADYKILLRGTNTLKAGQGPLIIIDGVADADLSNINYQEVESIDVLKDGSAAAIYGTRGTNGVIIITTKRARSGATKVEYDGQISTQFVARRAMPLSADEFRYVIGNYAPGLSNSIFSASTDWFKEITRENPISHKHTLAVSGGAETFSHRTVLNLEQNQGLQNKNDVDKVLFKTNIRQKALNGWLDMDYNAYISMRTSSPANYDAFFQAFSYNPTQPVYDPSNKVAGGYSRVSATEYFNPVAMINERTNENKTDDFGLNVRASLNILPIEGLKWDNFLSYTKAHSELNDYRTRYYPSKIGLDGVATIENSGSNDIQWESTLNYVRDFNKHSVQALLGYTYQKSQYNNSYMLNQGFDTDDYKTNNIGAGNALKGGTAEMSSFREENTYIAFFGRVMYNYDQKYLLSASLRRDGSSRFGNNNKWGWFPAVSVGWRIQQESFMKDVAWVNDLKLRAGYGVTGNQDFSNYKSLMMMGVAGKFWYNGQWINTYQPVSNTNPNLAWEKKHEWNVGLDFAVLDNRITGTVDYYSRKTTDLLYTYKVPTPPYVHSELFTNVGEISNSGIEVTLSGAPVIKKDFTWNTTFTFAKNKNTLDSFSNSEFKNGSYKVGWISGGINTDCQRLVEGQSLGTFYGPVWLGVDENGNDVLKGQSIDGTVKEDDWEIIGNAYPDFTLGWSNYFRYKSFDLSFSLRASIGGDVLNSYALEYENLGRIGLRNIMASWLDNPHFTGGTKYSSKYIEDASFLKLDNISLGYNINFKSKYISKMRLNVSAQNVFCITSYSGVDPEVSMGGIEPGMEGTSYYPRTAILTFGMNITF